MTALKSLRLLVDHAGTIRQVAKVGFGQSDASLYVIPYCTEGVYAAGVSTIPQSEVQVQVDLTQGITSEEAAKFSIHESGQVHVRAGAAMAGPLQIPRLETLSGSNVASISIDRFDVLPIHQRATKTGGREQDHIIPTDGKVLGGVILIFVNGGTPDFDGPCRLTAELSRAYLRQSVFVGLSVEGREALTEEPEGGLTIIGGWKPNSGLHEEAEFVYLRAR